MPAPRFPIETDRLLLRPYEDSDLEALHAMLSRTDVSRYLYSEPMSEEQSRESLKKRRTRTEIRHEGDAVGPAVIRKDTGELIGDVLLQWTSEEHKQGEVGYIFHPDHAGHGYATEAAREMLRFGFEALDLHRIYGRMDGRNTASGRLMERLGMRREAHLVQNELVKGEWTDEVIYGMLASEWADLRASSAAS